MKDKKDIIAYCWLGNRARVALSILASHHIESSAILEDIYKFEANGLELVKYKE